MEEPEPIEELEAGSPAWEPDPTDPDSLSVDCGIRHCPRSVYREIAATAVVGGVERELCPDCVENELGIEDYDPTASGATERWVTGKTVSAFVAGLSLSLIAFSLVVV